MGLVRTKILELPRPLSKSLSRIADDLNVSRQYVHQVVQQENISYNSSHNRLKPLCIYCRKNRVETHYRKYCRKCIDQNIHNTLKRTGKDFKCCKCNTDVYRRPALVKRMKTNGKVYCYNCYTYNR